MHTNTEILDAIMSEHFIKYPNIKLLLALEVTYQKADLGDWMTVDDSDFSRWCMFDRIPVVELLGHCFDIYHRLTADFS